MILLPPSLVSEACCKSPKTVRRTGQKLCPSLTHGWLEAHSWGNCIWTTDQCGAKLVTIAMLACLAAQISLLATNAAFPVKLHRPKSHDSLYSCRKIEWSVKWADVLDYGQQWKALSAFELQLTCASVHGLWEDWVQRHLQILYLQGR